MYVTRPLSLFKNSPDSLPAPPLDGPNSGYLVIQNDESVTPSCFGLSNGLSIADLPLPSNKIIKFGYMDAENEVFAIPVVSQPLSANRYYLIKAQRKHQGEAYVCSKEEDKGVNCGRSYIRDEKPRPLDDPQDIYQQFEFCRVLKTKTDSRRFSAKSIAPDGQPPRFLRNTSPLQIQISNTSSKDLILKEASGINSSLRAQLPDFSFPLSRESSPVCVGKWYCPFMFIHDGNLEDQVKSSVYYEMTLERRWERIFTHDSSYVQGNKVIVDVVVPTQVVAIAGKDAVRVERQSDNKFVWFSTIGSIADKVRTVGLSSLIVKRMIWEQERVGWVNGKGNQVRVVREEEYGGIGWWARFGCYVLVERFVLKRLDGSLVLTYEFKHTHQIYTKWE